MYFLYILYILYHILHYIVLYYCITLISYYIVHVILSMNYIKIRKNTLINTHIGIFIYVQYICTTYMVFLYMFNIYVLHTCTVCTIFIYVLYIYIY